MMDEPELILEPFPPDDLRNYLNESIDLYNIAVTGLAEWSPANFFLRTPRGEWIGGVLGITWGGWLHVRTLWVAEALRGLGHGSRLLRAVEAYAVEKGCFASTLETHSFQARPFYERHGYEVFGTLPDYPPGHAKFFLRKTLVAPSVLAGRQAAVTASSRAMKPPPSTREPSARS